MAIKNGLLAVLSLGPCYGLQLRDEVIARAPHRAGLNVGQVYSTLDRLTKAGLVEASGTTDDGLPLYALTTDGRAETASWLSTRIDPDPSAWFELLDQMLIASSIAGAPWRDVLAANRRAWSESARTAQRSDAPGIRDRLAAAATGQLAAAAVAWLDELERSLDATDDPAVALRTVRPARGRRPLNSPAAD